MQSINGNCDAEDPVRAGTERGDAMEAAYDKAKVFSSETWQQENIIVSSILSVMYSDGLDTGLMKICLQSASNCRRISNRSGV